MEQLMTVKRMRERYGCSNPTARKYLRMCNPHTENPVTAPMWAVEEWENSRTVIPAKISRNVQIHFRPGRMIVPRDW